MTQTMSRREILARMAAAGLAVATTKYWFLDRRMLRPYDNADYAVQLLDPGGQLVGEVPMPSFVRRGDMLVSSGLIPFPAETHDKIVTTFRSVRIVDQEPVPLFTAPGFIHNPMRIGPGMHLTDFTIGPFVPDAVDAGAVAELERALTV